MRLIISIFLLGLSLNYIAQNQLPSNTGFIKNKGQIIDQNYTTNADVLYMYSAKGINLQLRKNGYSYELFSLNNPPPKRVGKKLMLDPEDMSKASISCSRVDIDFVGMNREFKIETQMPCTSYLNYVINGTEFYNVQRYNKVIYKNIYNKIDIEFIISQNSVTPLKYNIILHPGADVNDIKFRVNGTTPIQINEQEFKIITPIGDVTEKIPFSYYVDEPTKNETVKFNINKNIVSFLSNHNSSKTFIIDPSSNIIWGTYFGGTLLDNCAATGIDSQNNIYIGGHANSTTNMATIGVYQSTLAGMSDAYLAKFNSNGVLQWCTYYGGISFEGVFAICVETTGITYVAGATGSTLNMASIGAHQTNYGGGLDDSFVVKFDANGQRIWSTYYGGNSHDVIQSIKKDANGDIVFGGHTQSTGPVNAIATPGSLNPSFSFIVDCFVAKLNPNGVRQWGTYYGDSDNEEIWDIATDGLSNIYMTGYTWSLNNISTVGSHQPFIGSQRDAFIAKLNPAGNNLIWGTYFGGIGDNDCGSAIEISNDGDVYVGGETNSPNSLTTPGCFQPVLASSEDIFLAKFNSAGVIQWGTYFGGDGSDYVHDIMIDPNNNILFCGRTLSTNSISVVDAYQPNIGVINTYDAYFAKFKSNGKKILASYFGKAGEDFGWGITLDNTGKLYMCGETSSPSGMTTPASHQPTFGGGGDAFLAKFCMSPSPTISPAGTASICLNDTYTLTASAGFTNYFWNGGANTSSISVGPLPQGNHYFTITVYDAFGCTGVSDTTKLVVLNCITGTVIDENISLENVNIYPVPANDFLMFEIPATLEHNSFEIYSSSGQLVLTGNIKKTSTKIDVSVLCSGLYFLKFNRNDKIVIRKFIKN